MPLTPLKNPTVSITRLDLLRIIYIKYLSKEINWGTFKEKCDSLNSLSSWVTKFTVDKTSYSRLSSLEPVHDIQYRVLDLLRLGKFKNMKREDFDTDIKPYKPNSNRNPSFMGVSSLVSIENHQKMIDQNKKHLPDL